ncbi:MAG: hypothetical protein HGGPFJEG_02980 [Ignavibacteria bacterium]|nr:hypothetical protein [Ignavibacteria bacterium]
MKKTKLKNKLAATEILFHSVLIERSKQQVAVAVDTELVNLYWNIGKTIKQNILQNKKGRIWRTSHCKTFKTIDA